MEMLSIKEQLRGVKKVIGKQRRRPITESTPPQAATVPPIAHWAPDNVMQTSLEQELREIMQGNVCCHLPVWFVVPDDYHRIDNTRSGIKVKLTNTENLLLVGPNGPFLVYDLPESRKVRGMLTITRDPATSRRLSSAILEIDPAIQAGHMLMIDWSNTSAPGFKMPGGAVWAKKIHTCVLSVVKAQ